MGCRQTSSRLRFRIRLRSRPARAGRVALALSLGLLASPALAAAPGRIVLAISGTSPIVLDTDGDGDQEVLWHLHTPAHHSIFFGHVTAAGGRQRWQLNFPPPAAARLAGDIDGDGRPEFFVVRCDSTGSWIEAYSFQRDLLRTFAKIHGEDHDRKPGWQGSVEPAAILRTASGVWLIASFQTGYDLVPRGVAAFEWTSGALAWVDSSAAAVKDVRVADVDGDGRPEITYTTQAVGNGARAGGRTDAESGITLLRADGRREAHVRLGGIFSKAHLEVADLMPRAGLELAVCVRPGPDDEAAKLLVFDGRLERLATLDLPGSTLPQGVGDLDGDSLADVLVGNDGGDLVLASWDGTRFGERRRARFPGPARAACAVTDGGERRFVVCGPDRAWLVDARLRVRRALEAEVAEVEGDRPGAWPILLPADLGRGLLLATTGHQILGERLLPAPPGRWALAAAMALAGAALGGAAAWLVARRRRATIAPAPAKPDRWQEILIAASNLAHGELAMSTLAALARRVREAGRAPALADGLGEVMDGFTNESAVKIQKLVEVAGDVRGARAGARDTARLLAAGRDVAGRMRDGAGGIALPGDAEAAAQQFLALASAADALRDEVLAAFDCDVPRAVERALAACRAELRQLGPVAVSIVCDRDPSGAVEPATIWPDELVQALCDLVRNALEAMRGARELRLELRVSWLPRTVAIRVTDSGRGIPRERWEVIFTGGGTGLPNARATLAFYRGSLGVEWSEPGRGTTMLVELARRRTSRMRPVTLVAGAAGKPPAARAAGA